jgi:hypothetical protein
MPIVGNVQSTKFFLYPIIIDDDAISDFFAVDTYNHHSTIILYNFGIVYQCVAFDEQRLRQTSTEFFFTKGAQFQTYVSAADRIFRMIYQSLSDQVQPQRLLELINGEIKTSDFDPSMSRKP